MNWDQIDKNSKVVKLTEEEIKARELGQLSKELRTAINDQNKTLSTLELLTKDVEVKLNKLDAALNKEKEKPK